MKEMSRRLFLKSSLLASSFFISGKASADSGVWPVLREWDFKEFEKYSSWFANIYQYKSKGTGKQKIARLGAIIGDDEMNLLNNPDFLEEGNPQRSKSDMNLMTSRTHCGSFPKLVSLYYAYRRGLPAVVSKINMESGGDMRYSRGNHPVGFVDNVSFIGTFRDFILNSMEGGDSGNNFVTGNFRTAPTLEGTDSVPIALDRQFLRPGTVCYNANGHCLVVGAVEESGEVHFLDAHTDKSITFNQTLSAIPRVNSARLGVNGLKNCYDGFRNIRFAKVVDGKAVYFSNQEMIPFGYSVEQYKDMAKLGLGSVFLRGENVSDFPNLVRVCLKTGIENPIKFLENASQEFADMMMERKLFVDDGWSDVLAKGPITFPNDLSNENIYQANGRWEVLSSPSSDVDRKNKYNYIGSRLEAMIDGYGVSQAYDYTGFSSQKEMTEKILARKRELFAENKLVYNKTNGVEVSLTLEEIEKRLFDLSFDPNHPPELRWGAPADSLEREGMKLLRTPLANGESLEALEAYDLEKGLRYYPIRQTTPTSLNPENNPKTPPFENIDVRLEKYLK